MKFRPKRTFKISIHELLERYQNQEISDNGEFKHTYLCYFIYRDIYRKSMFNRIWEFFFLVEINFKKVWVDKFSPCDKYAQTIEGWVVGDKKFNKANDYWDSKNFNYSTFRVLCLQQAAELHPDWVLEFEI